MVGSIAITPWLHWITNISMVVRKFLDSHSVNPPLRVGVATAEVNTLKGRVLLDLTSVANGGGKARGRPRGSHLEQQIDDAIVNDSSF